MNTTELLYRLPSRPIVSTAAVLVIITITVVGLKELASILQPLFFAIFIYYVGAPIAEFLKRKGLPSVAANIMTSVLMVAVVAGLIWVIVHNLGSVKGQLPQYQEKVEDLSDSAADWTGKNVPVVGGQIKKKFSLSKIPDQPIQALTQAIFGGLFGFASAAVLFIFYLVFIHYEAHALPRRLTAAFGSEKTEKVVAVARRVNDGIIGYVYVKTIVSLVSAVLSTIILFLFGVKLALLWGVLIFFGNYIPFVGSIVTNILPLVFALAHLDPIKVVWLGVVLVCVQSVAEEYLQPVLARDRMQLSPLVVLAAFGFWSWVWGIIGAFLSIPITVSLKYILENVDGGRQAALLIGDVKKGGRRK